MKNSRVAVYIDGFNLYYGIKSRGWRRFYWLDLHALSSRLLLPGQSLSAVKYFTSRVQPEKRDPEKPKRQNIYLDALSTLPDVSIHYGYFLVKKWRCSHCGKSNRIYEEKMTDVNIAVEMIKDAQKDHFDTAMVVSADSDLIAPLRFVQENFNNKRVVVAFPPRRHSVELEKVAVAAIRIGRKVISDSQLPDRIVKPDGYVLQRPPAWR